MGIWDRIRSRLAGTKPEPEERPAAEPEQDTGAEAAPDAGLPGTEADDALLRRLEGLRIADCRADERSFMRMRAYTFAAPFERADILNMARALRFLGFRVYSFSLEADGKEVPCPSAEAFTRAVGESAAPVDGATLLASYSAARVSCHIEASGGVQFTHDASRPVSFEPFEELFDGSAADA